MSIKDNPLLRFGEKQVARPKAIQADELARGSDWIARRRDGEIVVSYLKGELEGGEDEITVTETELKALETGEISLTDLLNRRGN